MTFRGRAVWSVFRKDVQALRLLIGGTVLLVLISAFLVPPPLAERYYGGFTNLSGIARFLAFAATGLLTVLVVQQDPAAGGRHDWLSRPQSRLETLAAKLLFALVFGLGSWLAAGVILGLRSGYGAEEMLIIIAGQAVPALAWVLAALAVASLGEGLLGLVVLGGLGLGAFIVITVVAEPVALSAGGSPLAAWVTRIAIPPALLLGAIAILALGYGLRRIVLARALAVTAPAIFPLILGLTFPYDRVWALQAQSRPSPAAAGPVTVGFAPGCFTRPPETDIIYTMSVLGEETTSQSEQIAGAIATGGLTPGARLEFDRVQLETVAPDGQVRPLRAAAHAARIEDDEAGGQNLIFGAEREAFKLALQRGDRLRARLAVTLMEPTQTFDLPLDGRRRKIAGFGYCGGRPDQHGGEVHLDCLKTGRQPELIRAVLPDVPNAECLACEADYTPKSLQGLSARRLIAHQSAYPHRYPKKARITTYRAAASFERTLEAPGALGAANCRLESLPPLPTGPGML